MLYTQHSHTPKYMCIKRWLFWNAKRYWWIRLAFMRNGVNDNGNDDGNDNENCHAIWYHKYCWNWIQKQSIKVAKAEAKEKMMKCSRDDADKTMARSAGRSGGERKPLSLRSRNHSDCSRGGLFDDSDITITVCRRHRRCHHRRHHSNCNKTQWHCWLSDMLQFKSNDSMQQHRNIAAKWNVYNIY